MNCTCRQCGRDYKYDEPKGVGYSPQFCGAFCDGVCNGLQRSANEVERLTAVLRDISRGDPFHEHPGDAELRPCDIVMDYAAYQFSAKQALEAKGPTP